MVAASSNRVAWSYHSDNGNIYRVAAVKDMTDQGLQGGESGAAVSLPKPASMKMRRLTVTSAAGVSRVIPIYSTDASILPVGISINVNINGTMVACTSSGNPIPESHTRHNVTRQSA